MLVLSRRIGEEILLPDLDVRIRLIKIKGKGATIGIEAPHEVRVLRGELKDGFTERETAKASQPCAVA